MWLKRKKKLEVPIERTADDTPFKVYEILTEAEKKKYQKQHFVSPIFGHNVKDEVVIPENVSPKKNMDTMDYFRTHPKLSKDDRIRKYGTAYPEFDLVKGKNLNEVLASQQARVDKKTPIAETAIIETPKDMTEESPTLPPKVTPAITEKFQFLKEEPIQTTELSHVDEKEKEPTPTQSFQPSMEKAVTSNPKKDKDYVLPPASLLKIPKDEKPDQSEFIAHKKAIIDRTFSEFQIGAHVHSHTQGPTVTRFEIVLDSGVRINKITQLQDNLKMNLSAEQIRIEAPIPGKSTVGIEVPNDQPETVHFYSIVESEVFKKATTPLTIGLGLDIDGNVIHTSIKAMPHGLLAGQTGSGKSVSINTVLISLLMRHKPSELRMMLIDPKMVELASFEDLPHLITPVITDAKAATAALKWAVDEMERRFQLFADTRVRDLDSYNVNHPQDPLPYMVIVVDELADLMMVSSQSVEESIMRLTQKARAAGIHLLIATQRPSTDVIKGTIKSNIPTRIAFSVASHIDSQTILDASGAEKLIGKGDMLFMAHGKGKKRLQGAFIDDEDILAVTEFIRNQMPPEYLFTSEELIDRATKTFEQDDLLLDVARFVIAQQEASINKISKTFNIGFNRAQSMVESLEAAGIVSENKGSKARDVLVDQEEATTIIKQLS